MSPKAISPGRALQCWRREDKSGMSVFKTKVMKNKKDNIIVGKISAIVSNNNYMIFMFLFHYNVCP